MIRIFSSLLLAALAFPAAASEDSSGVPQPAPVFKGRGEKCVEPTEFMRREHMNLILHQRDETVQRGIRTKKYSLRGCVNCHADPKTNSVTGPNGFCESCHVYTAVTIDCFSCHSSKREEELASQRSPHGPSPHSLVLSDKSRLSESEQARLLTDLLTPELKQ